MMDSYVKFSVADGNDLADEMLVTDDHVISPTAAVADGLCVRNATTPLAPAEAPCRPAGPRFALSGYRASSRADPESTAAELVASSGFEPQPGTRIRAWRRARCGVSAVQVDGDAAALGAGVEAGVGVGTGEGLDVSVDEGQVDPADQRGLALRDGVEGTVDQIDRRL